MPSSAARSPSEPLLLGFDLGTSRIKALLLDVRGTEAALASVPTPFADHGPTTEMPVPALEAAVHEVLGRLGDDRRRVAAVGVAGMAECGAPLDGRGRPLAPVIAWHDPRGAEVVRRVEERSGDELALRIGQRLRTVSSVAKLGWLVDSGVSGIEMWSGVPELVVHRLTGEHVTDFSLAARTGCYDVGARRWLEEVAVAAGVPLGLFPRIDPAGTVVGHVSDGGGAWSGLPPGVPVTLAGHDHLAGMVGCGAGADDLVNSVGTAETVLRRSTSLPAVDRALELRAAVTLQPDGGGWAVLVSAARAGRILSRAARLLGRSPADLDGLAEEATPLDGGELAAELQGDGAVALPAAEPGEIWSGLLRALAGRTADAVARTAELLGPAPRLVVFGGGAASAPWTRVKAEAVGLPVLRSTATEAVARGAAITAGVAAGWWASPAAGPAAPLDRLSPSGPAPPGGPPPR